MQQNMHEKEVIYVCVLFLSEAFVLVGKKRF